MSPTLVMTSAWWLDTTPQACWPLVSDAQRWGRWWRSIAEARVRARSAGQPTQLPVWRALLGLPLRLCLHQRAMEPGRSVDWQVRGDMHGSMTWVLTPALPAGCDLTCRWEVQSRRVQPAWLCALAAMLFERSHFARMRRCALDMGLELHCQTTQLREWSGRTRR